MPLPEVRRGLGALPGYLLEAVAAGRIALDDAERLLALAKRAVDLQQLGKPVCVEYSLEQGRLFLLGRGGRFL